MDAAKRYVTRLPLEQLWDSHGSFGEQIAFLTRDGVRAILTEGPIRFVEANLGDPLRWIELGDCFAYWKAVAPNIAGFQAHYLEDFPGEFFFAAYEWKGRAHERLIVLEKHH